MNKTLLAFLVFFLFFQFNLSSKQLNEFKNDSLTEKLEVENLENFFTYLKETCSSQKLLKNIKKHPSYPKFGSINNWKELCSKINDKTNYSLNFIKKNFRFVSIQKKSGILTGYYEPLLEVSEVRNSKYKFPILKFDKRFNGLPRKSIDSKYRNEDVLIWTNNKVDLFFLHIQGSGIGLFPNKKKIKILYSENNKKKYRSIGKLLVAKDLIKKKNISLFSIKQYLKNNEDQIDEIFNYNERYIFFKTKEYDDDSAIGALGMNLKPGVSIAVDKKYYPLGLPFLVLTNNFRNSFLGIASDTGSAIIGPNRADLFTGRGYSAEKKAGNLKKKLILYALVPYGD